MCVTNFIGRKDSGLLYMSPKKGFGLIAPTGLRKPD